MFRRAEFLHRFLYLELDNDVLPPLKDSLTSQCSFCTDAGFVAGLRPPGRGITLLGEI
jgi:hypothetical protein